MLPGFWFGVIAVLWAGFFLLEGFDFGVGILLPWVARTETERKVALRAIGPTWDGNEVWLLVAGGATFAAFPAWYASMFSGLYIPLAFVLAGLIVRGISIEYRGKVPTARGRAWCDRGIVTGSLLPALLLGVAFADLIRGFKMDSGQHIIGGFFDLVSPFGLLGGLVSLGFFCFHGAVFLALRTEGPVRQRAQRTASILAVPVTALAAGFLIWSSTVHSGAVSLALALVMAVSLVTSVIANHKGREGWSFAMSAVVALGFPIWVFASLWPNLIRARNHPAWSITVHNASSSHYALVVMTVVALVFTPVVLVYQGWAYWVFRARVSDRSVEPLAKLHRPAVSAKTAYLVVTPPDPAGATPGDDGPAEVITPAHVVSGPAGISPPSPL